MAHDTALTRPTPVFPLSGEELRRMEAVEFRARFRERVHHTLEIQTYQALHSGKGLPDRQTATVEGYIEAWKERGLPGDLPEFRWAVEVLGFARDAQAGRAVDLSRFAPHAITAEGLAAFRHIVRERRSVRHWAEREVPDALIEEVLEAGLWAAHSCNLQSIRYAVVREATTPGLFRGSDIPGGPVHLVVLQDERVYRANPRNPVRNRLLDAGAAAQNMVLAAHALGLGGVWLTFSEAMLERLYAQFRLPEEIEIVTYVDVGWPDQTPAPPDRLGLGETVLRRL